MAPDDLIDLIGSLYLLSRAHISKLRGSGYPFKEAFWIDFACLPFLPWDCESTKELHLSQVIRLYLGIWQFGTRESIKPEHSPAFIEILIDRYRMVQAISATENPRLLKIEIGRLALPGEKDLEKLSQAGSIVLATAEEFAEQRKKHCLPCRLVDDV